MGTNETRTLARKLDAEIHALHDELKQTPARRIPTLEQQLKDFADNRARLEVATAVALGTQFLCIAYVAHMIYLARRKIALMSFFNWVLRMLFAFAIKVIIGDDHYSILADRAMFNSGIVEVGPVRRVMNSMAAIARQGVNMAALVFITVFVITTDAEGEETVTDQIKDFTALVIIVEIDNMLAVCSRYTYEDLGLKYREVTLIKKFDRYVGSNVEKKTHGCCSKMVEGAINGFIDIT